MVTGFLLDANEDRRDKGPLIHWIAATKTCQNPVFGRGGTLLRDSVAIHNTALALRASGMWLSVFISARNTLVASCNWLTAHSPAGMLLFAG